MSTHFSITTPTSLRRFRTRIFIPLVLTTAAAIFAAAFGLYQAAKRSDAIAVERQVRETQQAISSSLDELAQNQEVIAVWDDTYLQFRKPELDTAWLDENVGVWLNELFNHDQVYVLDTDDAPIYAVIDGVRVEPSRFHDIAGGLSHLIDTLRGRESDKNSVHERLPGQPLHPDSSVRTSAEAIHATGLVTFRGRPAAASAMRIVTHTPELAQTGREQLAVSVRFLDGTLLQELSKRNLIEAPRISQKHDPVAGEAGWEIKSEHGELIGHFIWRPELPGTQLMGSVAPVAAVAIAVIVLVMGLLARRLYRSMRAQERTIIELQASEAQAQHLAFHDTLTGLPNRAQFIDRLDKALLHAQHGGDPVAILLLDLDRFKFVNDTLGHQAGDALIRDFATRLTHLADKEDTVARLGGDEFVILRAKAASDADLRALCERILDTVRSPFHLLGNSAFVGVSIGVATTCEAGLERVDLMRKTDIALYRAKAEGRDRYSFFSPVMDETVRMRRMIEEELRRALETGSGLRVHYQPQVAGADNKIIGLEALVRWQHPTLGLVPPDQFIGIAEGAGLIGPLGEWVLRQACSASLRWPDLFIAVNLSPAQFRSGGFADRLIEIVEESGADPRRIELEVTEGLLLDDSDVVKDALVALRAAGFTIALDDFGTGYSSLSYLRRFQVDKIKIDRSFVQHLGHAVDSAAIISAVLTLGQALGLAVTAEGVETREQYHFLEAAGCDVMQGYLFSKPLPEDEVGRLLTSNLEARGAA